MKVTNKIKIYLDDSRIIPDLHAVQGDTARVVAVSLYEGSTAWTIPTGAAALVRFRKSDGTGGTYDTLPNGSRAYSISGNTVTVTLAPQVLTVPGRTELQVAIVAGKDVVSTFTIILRVQADPSIGTVPSEDYNDIGEWILPQAIEAAEKAMDAASTATTAATRAAEAVAKAETLAKSVTSRMDLAFEPGSINTSTGVDSTGAQYEKVRIRSGYFPILGETLSITAPLTVRTRLVYYDENLAFCGSSPEFKAGFYDVAPRGAFARLIVGYENDAEITDANMLASMVSVYFPSQDLGGVGGAFYVTVGYHTNGTYTADKTFDELTEAYHLGHALCCQLENNDYILPLAGINDSSCLFSGVIGKESYRVTISKESVSVTSTNLQGKTPVKGVDYFTDADKQEIAEEVKASLDTIPAYVQTEAERVAENVLSVRTGRSFTFAAFADAHIGYNAASEISANHAGAGLKHIREITNLDMVAHLGDYINGGSDSTKAGSKAEYRAYHRAVAEGCRGIPTVWLEGNHDANYQGNDVLTPDELYAHIGANNQGDHVVEYGNETGLYGYMDFPAKRLRVIYLNTSDGWKTGVSDAQATWLSSVAFDLSGKADEESWGIIILLHIPVTFGDNAKLLSAIRNRNTKAELIAIFHGHCHNFHTEKVDGIWQIGIPELCVGRNNEYGAAGMDDEYGAIFGEFNAEGNAVYYPKIPGTAEDTSFNVVTIDRGSKTIHCHCFGAGYDRILSYVGGDAPVAYTVTNKLDNVVSSNASTTVQEGGSYFATLTAADGYVLDSVTVTMGGTDITAAAYVSGVVNVPAVTGNLVITAIAAEATSGYTNLFVAADVQTATRFNSSGEIIEGNFWCMSTYLAVAEGDVIRVWIPNGLWSEHTQRVICTYDSIKAHISSDIYVDEADISADGHTITAVVPTGVGYIRISGLPYNDAGGTVITINEVIE